MLLILQLFLLYVYLAHRKKVFDGLRTDGDGGWGGSMVYFSLISLPYLLSL